MVAGLVAAAVVLTTVGVTGFAAPGFLLGEDKADAAPAEQPGADAEPIDRFAYSLVTAMSTLDWATLEGLTCPDSDALVEKAEDYLANADNVVLDETRTNGDGTYRLAVTVVRVPADGEERLEFQEVEIAESGGELCWQDLVANGRFDPPFAEAALPAADLLDALDSGDQAGAEALLCTGIEIGPEIERVIGMSPDLELVDDEANGTYQDIEHNLTGTAAGAPVHGNVGTFRPSEDADWCVYKLNVYPS